MWYFILYILFVHVSLFFVSDQCYSYQKLYKSIFMHMFVYSILAIAWVVYSWFNEKNKNNEWPFRQAQSELVQKQGF